MTVKSKSFKLLAFVLTLTLLLVPMGSFVTFAAGDAGLKDLTVKDPYIFVDKSSQTYFMYAVNPDAENPGVIAYQSKDLAAWSDPAVVYTVPADGWNAKEAVISPEVALYGGKYYLFVTLSNSGVRTDTGLNLDNRYCYTYRRSVVVAVSDTPNGPFIDMNTAMPPSNNLNYMHRDGTLYVDPDGTPYLIYAHDWIQKIEGNFQAMPLNKDDLSQKTADQLLLFRASLAAFYVDAEYEGSPGYKQANADILVPYKAFNPQIYDTPEGGLAVVWTTEREGKAVVSQSVSRTGSLKGPWEQKALLFRDDRGTASSFTTLDGDIMLICQGPNNTVELYDAALTNDGFKLLAHRKDLDGLDVDTTDTLAPRIFPPATRLIETEENAAIATYTAKAYDNIDGWVDVTYNIPSGSSLAKGEHTVTATATDAAGNVASASFKVIIRDPIPKETPASFTSRLGTTYPNKLPAMGIHDPYIYYDPITDHYILHQGTGRNVWRSKDMINWSAPLTAFTIVHNNGLRPPGYNIDHERSNFIQTEISNTKAWFEAQTWTETTPWNSNTDGNWAAEMHYFNGKYYYFTTLHNRNAIPRLRILDGSSDNPQQWRGAFWRATIIAVSDSPEGPFTNMHWAAPVTPRDFMTLDGTLYVDHDGTPWLVYAHEWVQKCDGTMEAIPMTKDLKAAAGEPILMFRASYGSPWHEYQTYQWQPQYASTAGRLYDTVAKTQELSDKQLANTITDGPHIWETPDGSLVCLFTTYRDDEYIQTQLISRTGNIAGPWENAPYLDFDDKGHAMVFEDREGGLKLVMHNNMKGWSHNTVAGANPSPSSSARAEISDVKLTNDGFRIVAHRADLDGQVNVTSYADTLAPLIYAPASRYAKVPYGETGAQVFFNYYAMDDRDGWNYNNPDDVKVTVSHPSGSVFPVGKTVVTITAEDSKGNVSTETFSVYVTDKTTLEISTTTPTIVSTLAAYLNIAVADAPAGAGLKAYLDVDGTLLYETEIVNGAGRMHITKAPSTDVDKVYKLVVQGDGYEGDCDITVASYNTNIWAATAIAGEGDLLNIKFNAPVSSKTGFADSVAIGDNVYDATVASGDTLIVPVAYAEVEGKIVVSGVRYETLFPSYSFIFTIQK